MTADSGIGPDSTVVCYGYAPAMGLWLMKLYGHADVRILDCSRDAWRREDRPRGKQATVPPAAAGYKLGAPDGRIRADHAAVRARIYDPVATLLTYLLGRDHVRVYDGSWAEWGRLPDTPVAKP